jgi:hypothetical protein
MPPETRRAILAGIRSKVKITHRTMVLKPEGDDEEL